MTPKQALYIAAVYFLLSLFLKATFFLISEIYRYICLTVTHISRAERIIIEKIPEELDAEGRASRVFSTLVSCITVISLGLSSIVTCYLFCDGEVRFVYLALILLSELISYSTARMLRQQFHKLFRGILSPIFALFINALVAFYRVCHGIVGRLVFGRMDKVHSTVTIKQNSTHSSEKNAKIQ